MGKFKNFFRPAEWPPLWDIPNCILVMVPLTEPPPQPVTGKIKWYVIDKVLYTMDWLGNIHIVGPLPELPNG